MKKISKTSAKRMIKALRFALNEVREGNWNGLCAGIQDAFYLENISEEEVHYLSNWIKHQLKSSQFLEGWMSNRGFNDFNHFPKERYKRRKPWVEWMIRHLKETT